MAESVDIVDLSELASTPWHGSLLSLSACAFLVWDVLITLEQEAELVWLGKWSLSSVLYLLVRYFGCALLIVGTYLGATFATGELQSQTLWRLIGTISLIASCQIIFSMRVYALLGCRRWVLAVLVVAAICETSATIAIAAVSFLKAHDVPSWAAKSSTAWLPVVFFESLLFAMTIGPFCYSIYETREWMLGPILTTLLRDGVWAFAVLFVTLIIGQRSFAAGGTGFIMDEVAWSWLVAIFSFCGYRLLLNTRAVVKHPTKSHEELETNVSWPDHLAVPAFPKTEDLESQWEITSNHHNLRSVGDC